MKQGDWQLLGKGSSKDLFISERFASHLFFDFSDRVSVFDYGALPDTIPGKGAALRETAEFFFNVLSRAGILTCYDPEVSRQAGRMGLRSARHPKFPSAQKTELEFIPLEIIFRWGVPAGSSLLKRRPELKAFERFTEPLIEFSTKLESSDRLLSDAEAQSLAPHIKVSQLKTYAVQVAKALRDALGRSSLELWDGKIECAYDPKSGQILMLDALTPDELRVTLPDYEEIPLSKELLRSWIGRTNWAFLVREAKHKFGEGWKSKLSMPSPRLGPWRVSKLSALYANFARALREESPAALQNWISYDDFAPKICVIGRGGRECALRWKLESEGAEICVDVEAADLVWVSPDAELAEGYVDELSQKSIWTYGPIREAAKVEWSKEFGRQIAREAGVPIPYYTDNAADLRKFSEPPVVKFDGLAAGKGVVVAESWDEAAQAIEKFSTQGKVLLEERLRGFEASAFFALESGYGGVRAHFLGSAKDFKRRLPGDEGPNTGGMGAYAPHPQLEAADISLFTRWAEDSAKAMERRGLTYNGVLYIGALKDDKKGWQLLEYNARLGDPETEALVLTWPQKFLRPLLSLSPEPFKGLSNDRPAESVLCLALVHPDYPASTQKGVQLPPWDFSKSNLKLFRTASLTGRVAFLVCKAPSLQNAGDQIFASLVESPWRDLLEWRPDILR